MERKIDERKKIRVKKMRGKWLEKRNRRMEVAADSVMMRCLRHKL